MEEQIIILDFGSQYTQLIARKVRELNVYCEIYPFHHIPDLDENVKGIILSGSPFSVNDKDSPRINLDLLRKKYPILGLCYGAQLITHSLGGKVMPTKTREYGRASLTNIQNENELLSGMTLGSQVWMSHGDTIFNTPENFDVIASTNDVRVAGFHIKGENTYGIQFHPEVYHTTEGSVLLHNFINNICRCSGSWTSKSFVESTVNELKEQLGNDKVVLGLSGGVDSTVASILLHKAIEKNLYCIFVDNGLLRKNEAEEVLTKFKNFGLNLIGVDAKELFYKELEGISDPEEKRKVIGRTFIDVFDAEAKKIQNVKWLAQGTIYPDVIESISVKGPSATIKSHHNVGGLPEKMNLKIVEPLKSLFKDEVRRIGKSLNIANEFLDRHPFPGPGLGVRILGDVTAQKVKILQEADYIFIEGLKKNNLYDKVWQALSVLLPIYSVGVMGDERTYENVIALRAVNSTDGMTADWSKLPADFLAKVSSDIINRVKGVNRVVYDISSKPPSTIEWE